MAKNNRRSGYLRERVAFLEPDEVEDQYGGVTQGYVERFQDAARLEPRMGSEPIQAARLTGVQPYTMTVRSSTNTRAVTPAWRCYDVRAGKHENGKPKRSFNIKTVVNIDERNQWLEMLVVEGEAG